MKEEIIENIFKQAQQNFARPISKEEIIKIIDEDEIANAIIKAIQDVEKEAEILDEDIEKLIEERQAARKAKNFARADEIRDELLAKGIVLEDTREGVKWKRA